MKTRSRKPAANKSNNTETSKATIPTLEPSVSNPPQVFILPKGISPAHRVITLPNPATASPNRYLVGPEKGWFEFTRVAAPKRSCRSWLLAPDHAPNVNGARKAGATTDGNENEGYVLQTPDLMVATPVDPLFLLLPVLAQDNQGHDGGGKAQMYLTLSDYLDRMEETSEHVKQAMRSDAQSKLERMFEARIRVVCDVVEAGDETLFRLNLSKLLEELIEKARRMVKRGLPASMEERFVKRELAVPILSIKREESGVSATDEEVNTTAGADNSESSSTATSQDTQTSTSTVTSDSTAATSISSTPAVHPASASEEVIHLLRLRTALNFVLASYIPPTLRAGLESLLATSEVFDFTPLDKHLEHVNAMKKEAQALRSLSDNISRKRSAMEDDEAVEKAEAKKRKKEEEELRKKNTSRGVQQLKKADTSGMKKLSSFFTKASPKKG